MVLNQSGIADQYTIICDTSSMAALELARTFGVATVESATVTLEIDGCMNLGSSFGAHPLRGTHLLVTGSEVTGTCFLQDNYSHTQRRSRGAKF